MTPELWMTPEPAPIRGATMAGYDSEVADGEARRWLSWGEERRGEARPPAL